MKDKILIVSYYFYEENTPRSHRAFELARELSKYYDVKVLTTKKNIPKEFFKKYNNLTVEYVERGFLLNKSTNSFNNIRNIQKKEGIKSKITKAFKKIYGYFFWDRQIEASYFFYKYLKNEKENYKSIISIAFPFSSHLGVYLGLLKNKNITNNLILEYGDPFYYNKSLNLIYYFRILENLMLKKANYIVLPIEKAKEAFKKYNVEEKIKIIPQGFKLDEYTLEKYEENTTPTFVYAGIFYEKIRNPIKILKALNKINKNFKFIIYSDKDSIQKMISGESIINEIENSNEKIILNNSIPRKECIKEMSKADFLLNISNINQEQSPSKLIDYGIAKRPILSVTQDTFDENILVEFLNGDYHNQTIIDLKKYDIEVIGKQYKNLIENI